MRPLSGVLGQPILRGGHYLTPFYSPCVSASASPAPVIRRLVRHFPGWTWERWPLFLLDLAHLLLPQGLLPVGMAVADKLRSAAEPRAHYTGEPGLLIVQNTHRYFFYIAGGGVADQHLGDAIAAFHSPSGFGFGLGNVILTSMWFCQAYTISAIRAGTPPAVGSHFSLSTQCDTDLEQSASSIPDMQFAWITLGTLALTDFLHRPVAASQIPDLLAEGSFQKLSEALWLRSSGTPTTVVVIGAGGSNTHIIEARERGLKVAVA